ncbi:MAG: hypothetical protein U0V75_12560 [Ferruginibacter sp.]
MKQYLFFFFLLSESLPVLSQTQNVVINQTPCTGKEVQAMPALYYNHTKPKYGIVLNGTNTAADKVKIIATLNNIEKLEESSRKNFQATGCVMRVSYHSSSNNVSGRNYFSAYAHTAYDYQLGFYQMVCNVQQHVVKEVTEYRSVFRVTANATLTEGSFYGEKGDFYITDKSIRYEIPTDAKWHGFYDKQYDIDRYSKRSNIVQYVSEEMVLNNKNSDYNNKHAAFLKLVNGEGYVENWLAGEEKKNYIYKWTDRYYTVTKPGTPLLIPVTRKEFLEALLEYYEIEKYNFEWHSDYKLKNDPSKISIINADKAAYNQVYEIKKTRISKLLQTKNTGWLQQQVAPPKGNRENDYTKASNGLFDFYDFENGTPIYKYNPEYFKANINDPLKPVYFLVEFRYEGGDEKQWSENLLRNFEKNFDFAALQKMTE